MAGRRGSRGVEGDQPLALGTGDPGAEGADTVGLPGKPVVFCGRACRGVHHQTVQRCVERAAVEGPMAALDDRLPPGKAPTITAEAKAWRRAFLGWHFCWITCTNNIVDIWYIYLIFLEVQKKAL
jgi:hypothetical protein